jgi:hypothetical protein
MTLEEKIRKLAKSNKGQNLFLASKEVNGIRLFKNSLNFSRLQDLFLSYLFFYRNLSEDIALKKVSDKVTDNIIFEDAYASFRQKKGYDLKETKKENKKEDLHIVFDNKENKTWEKK